MRSVAAQAGGVALLVVAALLAQAAAGRPTPSPLTGEHHRRGTQSRMAHMAAYTSETDRHHTPIPGSCSWYVRRLCRPHHDVVPYSSQLQCILPKLHKIPNYCRPAYRDAGHCLADMQTFCPDLSEAMTAHCMEEHVDLVSAECVESHYFEQLHEAAGRETIAYQGGYRAYRDAHQASLDEPTPAPHELPQTEGYMEEPL